MPLRSGDSTRDFKPLVATRWTRCSSSSIEAMWRFSWFFSRRAGSKLTSCNLTVLAFRRCNETIWLRPQHERWREYEENIKRIWRVRNAHRCQKYITNSRQLITNSRVSKHSSPQFTCSVLSVLALPFSWCFWGDRWLSLAGHEDGS